MLSKYDKFQITHNGVAYVLYFEACVEVTALATKTKKIWPDTNYNNILCGQDSGHLRVILLQAIYFRLFLGIFANLYYRIN